MNGEILERSTGESHIVQSYTKPLTSPIGKAKVSKVYMEDMNFYVTLN